MLLTVLLIILLAYIAFIGYYKWCFGYWKRMGIPYIEPRIPFGNNQNPISRKKPFYYMVGKYYNKLKAQGHKHGGLYMLASPRYMAIDLEYIKNVLSKDFGNFVDRGFFYNEKDDPLSAHLFSISGDKWRMLRTKLTPTFTSGKMRSMFQTLVNCAEPMMESIESSFVNKEPIDIKEIAGCFTTDVIGSVAFGLDCNCFEDPNAAFRHYGKKIFKFPAIQILKFIICNSSPALGKFLHFHTTPDDVTEFFQNAVKNTIEFREQNQIRRNDFMQILLDLKNDDGERTLTFNEIAAQAFVFFVAGFETSSSTVQFCMFELARNKEIQTRLREEILETLDRHQGIMTYEAIYGMKYLNQILDETLRLYPPLPILTRSCTERYEVPDSDLVLEENCNVMLPILAVQTDPEYFPNPMVFDPERFSDENKSSIKPYSYLPFGEGPRNCIGKRFGLMQVKVGVVSILKEFEVSINPKTPLPLVLDANSFIMSCESPILLDVHKVS